MNNTSNILVFWKSPYPPVLEQYFDPSYIYSGLSEINIDQFNDLGEFDGIVILCELNKNEKGDSVNLQEMHGIEVAKKLRLNNCRLPIIFTSFLSHKQVYNNNPERDIVNSIGHKFVRLPVDFAIFSDMFSKMKKLTDTELRDVQISACNPKGIVNTKIHQITDVLNKLKVNGADAAKEELISCLDDIHKAFKVNSDEAITNFKLKFDILSDDNINDAITFVDTIGKRLIAQYSIKKTDYDITRTGIKKSWKLLLLDDELNSESELIKRLDKMGVESVCTQNADEANKVLNEDKELRGKISVILTDFRLYEKTNTDGIKIQQDTQGYTFLQDIGNTFQSRILSGVVYSGLPRQFLLETFSTFKIRPEIYSKIDFRQNDEGAMNFLASRLIELGDKNYETILALPLGNGGWRDNLHTIYLKFRNHPSYEVKEKDISDYCKNWIEEFKSGLNPETPMIKGDAFQQKVNEDPEDTILRFEAYFKTRRLAQYLYLYFQKLGYKEVLKDVRNNLRTKSHKTETESAIKGFFSQILGLSLTEFPFGATIEELNWFDYDMGIKVLDNYRSCRNKFNHTEILFGKFFSGIKDLTDEIEKNDYKYEIIVEVNNEKSPKAKSKKPKPVNPEKANINKNYNRILTFTKNFNPNLFDRLDLNDTLLLLDKYKEPILKENGAKYFNLLKEIDDLWKSV